MKVNLKGFLTKINFIVTSVILLLYFAIRFKIRFLQDFPSGDETSFLRMFNFYLKNGYSEALSKGNSIVFNLMASFFNLFTDNELMSLRLTSLFFGVLAFLMVLKIQRTFFPLNKSYFLLTIITSLNTLIVSSVILSGINDTILYFLITVFIFYVLKFHRDKKVTISSLIIGIIIGFMFLTRKISITFLPSILLILLLLYHNLKITLIPKLKSLGIIFIVSIATLVLFNLPNLIDGKGISFHEKKLDSEINWKQLQYLSAIKNSQGKVIYGQHVTIGEVKHYIKKNGNESLPKDSQVSSIFFDFSFTIKQFFKNIPLQIIPITRLSGLLLLFLLLGAFLTAQKEGFKLSNIKKEYITLFLLSYILAMCFIVISYIEPRWYVGALILLPLPTYSIMQKHILRTKRKELLNFLLINAQLSLIIMMNTSYILANYKYLLQL
tara:strand:+ start:1649 stop:2962 length:1314 start_codon:yes stop_codon:yes gene_type:complete